jgi:N-acyl homoserine lactone hydrolase
MKVRAEARRLTGPLPGGREGATVAVEPILTGTMRCPRAYLERASSFATAFVIRHPGAGPFLVDTGLHASVASKPAENLGRVFGGRGGAKIAPGRDLPAQLRDRGIEPKALKLVVMTHMHFDHTSGMSQFPGAMFLITEEEWTAATTESRPLLRGYRPAHFDYAFDYRTISYDSQGISSYASFGRTFDLFGDGSVRLASTPGHSAGHQSVICRLRDRDLVIAGDAIYTLGQLADAPEPPRPVDRHNWQRSMRELRQFAATYPQAVVIPGHDPDRLETFAKRYE